jgi:hypothetical protein
VLWMALELLKLKASNRWSDSSFSTLYGTYLAKKIICPLTLGVAKIHACLNHYILYQKEHEFKDKCPRCNDSRYKRNDNNEKDLKDQRRQPEGGEWEPIKIPCGNLAYIAKSTRCPSLLTRPRWHSHRKAIGPQNWVRNRSGNMN